MEHTTTSPYISTNPTRSFVWHVYRHFCDRNHHSASYITIRQLLTGFLNYKLIQKNTIFGRYYRIFRVIIFPERIHRAKVSQDKRNRQNQVINMHPSPGSGPSSSKRKLESSVSSTHSASSASASAYSSSFNSPSESHVFIGHDTEIPNWNQSKEGKEVVQKWIQIDNIWTDKARIWSQHEFEWYRRMNDLYQRWSTDENSDMSMHPKELIWASIKLDQAKRETIHCREWISYARWQVASRTGKVVGVCPPLPSLEGRIPVGNNGKPLHLGKEKDGENDNDGDNSDDNDKTRDENRSAGFGSAKHPVQALVKNNQAPIQDLTQNTAQPPHEASENFVALVKSTSQSSTAVKTHFQTFTKAAQAPVKNFTPQDANSSVSEEFAAFLKLQEASQNHIAFQTPVHGCFQASKQAVARAPAQEIAPANDSVDASLQFRNLPPVRNPSVPTQQAHIQGSTRVFRAPGSLQAPIQAPIHSPQGCQPLGNLEISPPQGPVPSQQQNDTQALEPVPLLTFEEFISNGPQELSEKSAGQPVEGQQPSQQPAKRPTQMLNQGSDQPRIQKSSTPKSSPKVIQRVTKRVTPQPSQKTTQSPTQQPTQSNQRLNNQPTPQPTRHDTIPDSHKSNDNATAHGNATPHNNTSGFGEPRETVPPPADKSNYLTPSLSCEPAAAPTPPPEPAEPVGPGPTGPAEPTGLEVPAILADPVFKKLVSDWWDGWVSDPTQIAPPDGWFGPEIDMLSGQPLMPELAQYFDENIGTLAPPVWDDFE